ncbi:rhodanese-like domain-containing protein [Nocardia transvalensis]|uniref:rhodanese-like domain-containing protein n=1 Tax=Nocardia transvalensis TaxID=37333 RepID=UPI003A5D17E1
MTSPQIPSVPVDAVPAEFDAAEPFGAAAGHESTTPPAMLLDVREDDEWQLGHAPGALHIPMADVPARVDELDYDSQIYVVCRQGGRSLQVVQYLTHVGFDAIQVTGGMVAWQKSGRPLTGEGDHEAKIY